MVTDSPLLPPLGVFRRQTINIDGADYWLCELSAMEAFSIWQGLEAADGNHLDVYLDVVRLGLRDSEGDLVFGPETELTELGAIPARILIPLAQKILALSEIEKETPRGNG